MLRDQLGQRRLPSSAIDRSNRHGECFSTAHKYSQLLGSRHSRVDEVPKQHLEMLRVDWNDDRFKLTPLRFMDGHRIRKSEFGQILFGIRYDLAARSKTNPATIVFRIDRLNPSDVAVEDPKIVIISRLDHAIAFSENLLSDCLLLRSVSPSASRRKFLKP